MWTEAEMIPAICSYFERQGYVTFTEMRVGGAGYGIADVVAVKFDINKVRERIVRGQTHAVRGETVLEVLTRISAAKAGTKLEKIENSLSYSREYLKGTLIRTLQHNNFIEEIDKDVYRRINYDFSVASEIIAIEAKKEAWKAATQQARRYQFYANKAYVALLSDFVHRVDIDRLRNNSIGLLSVDMNINSVKAIMKPRRKMPLSEMSTTLANESIWEQAFKSGVFEQIIGSVDGNGEQSTWI